jgi:hypothetical protein
MVQLDQLKALATDLRRKLKQVDQLTGRSGERDRDARRKRDVRATAKEVFISVCEDRDRRERLEGSDTEWLRHYFPDLFWYEFTLQQREMIDAIRNAIVDGGDQALAASRGEGKTKIFERMLLKYTLAGKIKCSVLFAATGSLAQDSLQSIMHEVETNDGLHADYPEVCVPVRALEHTPNRAHYQLVTGKRHDDGEPYVALPSRFSWCGQEIVLPNVPGSPAAGAIIATRGLDSAVRGFNKRNRRVDVAGIDDPDTEETVNNEEQAAKLEKRIDRAIAGLGGQQRSVARVMLTTLQNRICCSYRFTDPKQKPSWKGKRFRFLVKPPERTDLWEEYVQLRQADWHQETDYARAFYAERRTIMDAGAEVANPHRHTAQQLSALQFYYDQVARTDAASVSSEYDNDPPEETGLVESGITPHRIQKQVSGYPRKVIPPGCTVLTQGIDVRKVALHWVVRAWRPDGTGFVIDYGVHEVHGTVYGSDEGLDVALKRAILARIEATKETEYVTTDGKPMPVELTLVDAGFRTQAVYGACAEVGLGVKPIMGFGKSSGCTQANFSDVQRRSQDRKPGDGWFLSRRGRVWLVCADTDRWKAWEHDRWMTATDKPGSLQLFGEPSPKPDRLSADEKAHHSYARHLCNEIEIEEPYKDTIRRRWKAKSDNTHWLDASYYSSVAANILGIRLIGAVVAKATKNLPAGIPMASGPGKERLSLAQMAAKARKQ